MSYSDWKEFSLLDVCKIHTGKSNRIDSSDIGEYPFYDRSQIIKRSNKYLFDETAIIVPGEGVDFIPRFHKGKYDLHQRVYSLVPNSSVNPKFIYYSVLFRKEHFNRVAVGSTVKSLRLSSFDLMRIRVPSKTEQNLIVDILSSLDDKIELNQKINKNLEELAQTLYKQWFVDFEFPNEEGLPYKSSGGEMVESELGFIPKGWRSKKIDEISDLQIGRTPPRKEKIWFSYNPSEVKWYSIKDMGNSGVYIDNPSEFLTYEAIRKFNIPTVEANTVLLSFKLTIGRLAITTSKCTTNEAIAHLNNLKENISPNFLYLFLKNFNYESLGNTSSIATAVNSKIIKNIKILIPDKNTLSKFSNLTDQVFNQIKNLQFQNQNLSKTRDLLLPKLMSGEIEVPTMES
jgi:type I restriction enzyme, S subunit